MNFRSAVMTETSDKTVLITGTSSGVGRASALLMAHLGFEVFAGVRKLRDGEKLQAEAGVRIVPIVMDVADPESINTAASALTTRLGERGLDGLVNVAGIGTSGPLEYIDPGELKKVFEVNVFGQIAVIQAFVPLLRKTCGRIVNISSVVAHIAVPFGGALAASKSAFGSLSDTLRLELRPFGIHVCVVEPGSIHTPAVDKTLGDVEGRIRRLPPDGARLYGNMLRNFTRRAYAQEQNGSAPEVVARVVSHALTARRPRIRYIVGKGARQLTLLPKLIPERALDHLRMKLFGLPVQFGH